MTARLVDDLAELDGNEQFHLAMAITDAMCTTSSAIVTIAADGKDATHLAAMLYDLGLVREDVLLQAARITVPFRHAQGMIATVLYRRRHPVRVPGT